VPEKQDIRAYSNPDFTASLSQAKQTLLEINQKKDSSKQAVSNIIHLQIPAEATSEFHMNIKLSIT